ncbi:MAG: ATP-binding protein [Myxococcota bacterium]
MTAEVSLSVEDFVEGRDFEIKRATGRHGRGELPKDFWPTYSAMANTGGGVILLGVAQGDDGFQVKGISEPGRILKPLWDGLNNRQVVSANVLTESMVTVENVGSLKVVVIRVPRAARTRRPVFVGSNPLTGTYLRQYEGDYHCSKEAVKRMLADASESSADGDILPHYGIGDLVPETLAAYRNQFRSTKSDHPWIALDDTEFLRMIGGFGKNRETGEEGLTKAGLLMFGGLSSILEAVPNYVVDYQERAPTKAGARWVDRVTTDGTWPGNVFEFYRLVIRRLQADLKVPFRMEGNRRIDESGVHQSLREGLVNTLVHADYNGRVSVLVVKSPDMFSFRNPGTMRIPVDEAVRGGSSDCRNRKLQKMFQLAGLGEQAGSGIPKIYSSWKDQSWRLPEISERFDIEQTILQMRMVSLFPEPVIESLRSRLGPEGFRSSRSWSAWPWRRSKSRARLHSRMKGMSTEHSRDITLCLTGLVRKNLLDSHGETRGTVYFFPGEQPEMLPELSGSSTDSGVSSTDSGLSSTDSGLSSTEIDENSPEWHQLMKKAAEMREKKRISAAGARRVLLELCDGQFRTLQQLSKLVDRNPAHLRQHYLSSMAREGLLELLFRETPNHPAQAYRKVVTAS